MIGSGLWRVLGTLALVGLVGAGCSRSSAEAMKQRTEMTQEHQAWRMDIAQWENDHEQMKAWHQAHPASAADTANVNAHEAKLAKHEDDVREFKQAVDDLDTKIQDPKNHAEAELLAEHLKLKAQYEMLKSAHDSIKNEHDAMASADSTAARGMLQTSSGGAGAAPTSAGKTKRTKAGY